MTRLKAVWSWCRRNVVGILTALAAALGAGILWNVHRGRIRKLEDEVAIRNAHERVAALDARRSVLAERSAENAVEIEKVQQIRAALQRDAVAIEQKVEGLSDEQVEAEFRRLF